MKNCLLNTYERKIVMGMTMQRDPRADDVTIRLDKRAGEETVEKSLDANSTEALINGMAHLVIECASVLGFSVMEVLAVLATALVPKEQEG